MKRTTVKIPDELDARLRQEAQRSGKTISEVTREALNVYLGVGGQADLGVTASGRPRVRRLLAAGSMSDGSGIAARVEEILAEQGFGERT